MTSVSAPTASNAPAACAGPDNIVRTGEPSRSAWRVAQLRAVHQLLDEPILLDDPVALPILGPDMATSLRAEPFELNDPLSRGLRAGLVARSRVAEDELARAVAAGVRQYVVLGAGLDTFAYRNPFARRDQDMPGDPGLQVFEVDHPSTQRWKRACLNAAGIAVPQTLRYVPVDFESEHLPDALAAAGFRADLPACFSWLGVVVYLTEQAVMDCLTYVASLPVGTSITFDYRVPVSRLNPVERALVGAIEQQVTALGEPWRSSFDPTELDGCLRALGFREVDDPGPEVINARYFARRKDGLRCGSTFRQVCART